MRSVILVISFQAAVIACILSYAGGMFAPVYSVLLIVGLVSAHTASNLTNDYFGYTRNYDTLESPRRRYTIHPLASGVLSRLQVKILVAFFLAVGLSIALFFTYLHGIGVLAFVLAGIILMVSYDATPVTLKQLGLGEMAAFIVWGPLMIEGGFYALTGQLSLMAFLVSIPYGLGVMSILLGKHLDQMAFDRSKKQNTLPVILGTDRAKLLSSALIIFMYLLVLVFVALREITAFALLVFINLPRAVRAVNVFLSPKPKVPPKGYVGWPLWYHRYGLFNNRNFGWLFIIGLLTGAALGHFGYSFLLCICAR